MQFLASQRESYHHRLTLDDIADKDGFHVGPPFDRELHAFEKKAGAVVGHDLGALKIIMIVAIAYFFRQTRLFVFE